jgi:S-phase kinase-associated protein 1
LLDVLCKTIADWLRGHTTEEMRDILGVTSDFTPEEEAQCRYELEWLEEIERYGVQMD